MEERRREGKGGENEGRSRGWEERRGGAGDGKRGREVRRGGGSGEFRNLKKGGFCHWHAKCGQNFLGRHAHFRHVNALMTHAVAS